MKLSWLAIPTVLVPSVASAGGLFLPGAGAVSTARAGASVAATDDGEALTINPAGIAKVHGTVFTFGIAAIDYVMSFARAGKYPNIMEEATTYANTPYPVVENDAKPPLGLGAFQPVPLIAVVSDLGQSVKGLYGGVGVFAPNAYPFRNMTTVAGHPYVFNSDFDKPPPPTRYDIMHQEAAIILPSVVVAYHIAAGSQEIDVGARVSAGVATLKSTVAVWGLTNHEEWIKQDGTFAVDAKGFVPTGAIGATYRPNSTLELGFDYNLPIIIHAKGDAVAVNGPAVSLNGAPVKLTPTPDNLSRCQTGGTDTAFKACVDVELPMTAQLGGRYKFLDAAGKTKGDIELDVGWEHWGAKCDYINDPLCLNPSDYRVVVDAQVGTQSMPGALDLKDNRVSHGFQDSYNVRLGGSWSVPSGTNTLIARGGIGYDTATAKPGWERADLDGAARTTIAAGASYKLPTLRFDAGIAVILEGTRTQDRNCVVTGATGMNGCGPGGTQQTSDQRQGPDPLNPILVPDSQLEHPVNQGTFKSHYLMFMLGASYWF